MTAFPFRSVAAEAEEAGRTAALAQREKKSGPACSGGRAGEMPGGGLAGAAGQADAGDGTASGEHDESRGGLGRPPVAESGSTTTESAAR